MSAGYPELFVIGAQKCGTTTLWAQLDRHPEISMTATKETNHFLWHYEEGAAFYDGLFDTSARIRGEACPNYTALPFSEGVAGRIAEAAPRARLIYAVRDPVDRIVAHWMHTIQKGVETADFAATVAANDFALSQYVLQSRYWSQLQPYLAAFPRGQVRVILLEDLGRDPVGVMRDLYGFAGVDPQAVPADALHQRLHRSDTMKRPPRIVQRTLLHGARLTTARPSRRRLRVATWLTSTVGRPIGRPSPGPAERERIAELVGADVAELARFLGRPLWGVNPVAR